MMARRSVCNGRCGIRMSAQLRLMHAKQAFMLCRCYRRFSRNTKQSSRRSVMDGCFEARSYCVLLTWIIYHDERFLNISMAHGSAGTLSDVRSEEHTSELQSLTNI